MKRAALWIIGGPNGAGKTTLATHPRFRRLLRGVRFLNPDQLALIKLQALGRRGFHDATANELKRCFIEAAEAIAHELRACLAHRESVGVESVLSTQEYCPLVEHTLAGGGFFGLIYVALKNPDLSRQRVAQRVARRVAQGGHDVPSDRLARRWSRSVENLGWFAKCATRFWVVDNSDSTADTDPKLIANEGTERLEILDTDAIPEITASLRAAFHSPG